ncbi:MAG: HAMP domain-containing histidine kinase [Butyrivibrio sp.]|nr:HAMP domain-containing histidine kinase [Butyrivibrio sp.]
MKRTLYIKFLFAYLLFGLFGFIAVATFVSSMTLEHVRRDTAERLYAEATQIANTYAADLYNSETSLEAVQKQLTALSKYMDDSRIWIVNPSGRLVLDTTQTLSVDTEIKIENFDQAVTAGSYYVIGDFMGFFDQDYLSVFAPITSNYKVQAYVVIHYPMNDIRRQANELLNISYIVLLVLLLLSLIILIFFTELVYIPLKKITLATEQYAAGNMSYEFTVESEDEMGYLAASLSYMAGEIARQESDQKKFIANVSHDFRSPLTSIRGYLVAMQDGTIPPEMHEKYLGIVLNETERLTKLTNGLLTLNNLNTKGMLLDKADFDINNVIRNTAASFEVQCMSKNLAIELVLTEDEMLVNADMSKIQQVLYNLIDNAIKFSHHDSVIKVETTEKKKKVFISVKDSGIGIPKDDQKLIFDRFYKSDSSRGKDKKGTGLGLSIVKEIIKAHGENINVISTVGVGTEFIFSLPKSKTMDDGEDVL